MNNIVLNKYCLLLWVIVYINKSNQNMRHHIGAGYPHTHGMGMGGGAFDLENGATETKGRFKDKPVGDYAQIGHHVVPLTWSRLTKWLICLCILMVCLDFFIEAIDHVVSEHGTHDENGEYQSLHSKHAELLQKGVQADLQKMRTSFRQGRQPTAAGEKPEPALEKPRTLQYEEGMVLDEFCEDEDVSGIPISEDEMMNQVSSGKGHWVHVTTPSTEGETANTDDTCARICSWKDKVDSVVPFGLCTFGKRVSILSAFCESTLVLVFVTFSHFPTFLFVVVCGASVETRSREGSPY